MEKGRDKQKGEELRAKGSKIKWRISMCLKKEEEHCMRNIVKE